MNIILFDFNNWNKHKYSHKIKIINKYHMTPVNITVSIINKIEYIMKIIVNIKLLLGTKLPYY